ncbi:AraC family transcriptional regulator [Catenibacillus scindens]|uniref:AraC family transcriptional regulator n=1 Tax=Catenibacillus scindens TaxID=673271 RepID=UPI0032099B98
MSAILLPSFVQYNLSVPFQIKGIGINHHQEPINRPSGFPLYQWIQCVQGCGTLHINGTQYTIRPGQGMFLWPDQPHSYQSAVLEKPWVVHFICFKGSGIETLLKDTQLGQSGVFTLNEPDMITAKLKQIHNSDFIPTIFTFIHLSESLYDLLLHLMIHTTKNSGTSLSVQNQRIAPVVTYIHQHYSEPLFLDSLAELCGFSQEYLCQLFKKATGMRIFEYIQRTRIKYSKKLLMDMPNLPSRVIGEMCGFNSSSYFNRIFKKFEQISPGEFRRQNGIYD